MPTTFPHPVYFTTTLKTTHTSGAGTLILQTGDAARLGSLGANEVYAVTTATNPGSTETNVRNFRATGLSTDTLTGVTVDADSADATLLAGTPVQVRVTKSWMALVHSAVNTLETAVPLKAPIASPTFTGLATIPSASLARYVIPASSGSVVSSTLTFNCATNNCHEHTLAGNRTIVLSGASTGQPIRITLVQAASGGPYTADWSGLTITWKTSGAVAPDMPTGAGDDLIVVLNCTGSGTYDGFLVWPILAGEGGDVASVFGRTGAVVAAAGDIPIFDVAVTGAVTLTSGAYGKYHVCSGTSADYTVTLPTAAGHAGGWIGFRMAAALTKLVTIDGASSETIDGAATRVMWAGEVAVLESDGANWSKISGKSIPMVCDLYLSATQTGVAPSTATVINLDGVNADNTGLAADATNHRIVVPRPGLYCVQALAGLAGGSIAVPRLILGMNANGVGSGCVLEQSVPSGNVVPMVYVSKNISLAPGDLLTLTVFQNSATSQDVYGDAASGQRASLAITEIPSW